MQSALDRGGSRSTHNVEGDNLPVRFLDLLQLTEIIPKARLGDDIVGRKDPHAAVTAIISASLSALGTARGGCGCKGGRY